MLNAILFADDTVPIAEKDSDLRKLRNVFDSVCKALKLKNNINKSKVTVFERNNSEVDDVNCPHKVRVECPKECEIRLNGEKMGKVHEFKYSTLV